MKITGAQAKAARLLLGWSQRKLAIEAHVSNVTISTFESRKRPVSGAIAAEIRYVLEKAGVEFPDEGERSVKFWNANLHGAGPMQSGAPATLLATNRPCR